MVNRCSRVAHPSSRRRARRYAVAAISLLGLGIALAAPGDLDPDFNGSGLFALKVGIGGYAGNAEQIVQQSDGKLVLAGWGVLQDDDGADFLAVRLSQNGTLDSSFGTEGVASADFDGYDDLAFSVIEQPDGKLILAGFASVSSSAYGHDIALARFDVHGSLDKTFGTDGLVTLDLGGDSEFVMSQVLQPDGRLVTAAGTNSGGFRRCTLVRFNADGSLDTAFGVGGSAPIDFGGVDCAPGDLEQQSDGKLVLAATVGGVMTGDFAVARLTADGMLDASFDGDGMLVVDFDGNDDEAKSIAIQPDKALVIAGYSIAVDDRSFDPALVRINGNGTLDDGFGSAGRAIVDLGHASALYSIVAQADGTFVATGFRLNANESGSSADLILARFSGDGALDTSFGIDGVATADFGSGSQHFDSRGYSLIQQSDGKLVATGSGADYGSFIAARFADDSKSAGRVGLTVTNQSVAETAGKATFVVRRTGGRTGAISVNYATAAGSAQSGLDLEAASGTLNWGDGDTTEKEITIDIIDDDLQERPEDFSLTLSAPTGGAQLAASVATTTITSTDGPGELRLIWLYDDHYVSEGTGVIRLFVRRLYGLTGEVSVQYHANPGSASAGSDFAVSSGMLTWAEGDTGTKSIAVEILDDAVPEAGERFDIQISNPTGGATISTSRQNVFVVDNDPGLGFAVTQVTVGEAAGTVSLTVSRSGPANGAVSVNYATASGTAGAGSDFTATSGALHWAAGDSASKTIPVDITNDSSDESNEVFTVTLSNPSGIALWQDATATVRISDDDVSGGGGGVGGGGRLQWSSLVLGAVLCLRRRRGASTGCRSGRSCPLNAGALA